MKLAGNSQVRDHQLVPFLRGNETLDAIKDRERHHTLNAYQFQFVPRCLFCKPLQNHHSNKPENRNKLRVFLPRKRQSVIQREDAAATTRFVRPYSDAVSS
jgi:hypothetical protein